MAPESEKLNAAKATDDSGFQFHIRCKPGDLPGTVLLPGDPDRSKKIALAWDDPAMVGVARHRQYYTYKGVYKDTPVAVTSTGIGPAATEIAVTELARVGARTLIRVGSCGALQKHCRVGDLIISSGAVRLEDSSLHYARETYPAVADYEVVLALVDAAEELGARYHVGLTASTSSFYLGQGRPGHRDYFPSHAEHLVADLQAANVLNFEMEASLLFVMSQIYSLRAGAVCAVYANRVTNELEEKGEDDAIAVANLAAHKLGIMDGEKRDKDARYWHPGLLRG